MNPCGLVYGATKVVQLSVQIDHDHSDKSVAQIAKDSDLTDSALRNWVERSSLHGVGGELSGHERQELVQLRKDVRVLRMERDL